VDTQFYGALPSFKLTGPSNSEVTWLCYPLRRSGADYTMGKANVVYSEWDSVREALREGAPPEKDEIIDELQQKLNHRMKPARILSV
jgi:hypothetical protein